MQDAGRDTTEAKASMLEVMVEAALHGHDLGPFEPAEASGGGYNAVCRQCGWSVWVGNNGLMYTLLKENCSAGSKEVGEE
jgi:hypothetical protein